MPPSDLLTKYAGFATNLGLDLVAIFLMTYVLYFRRHWRSDLLLSYVALNMGIFVVMSVLSNVRVDIAVGFGLFAILSIIRLRSSAVTQQEVAYYLVALVLGLINGINLSDRLLLVAMNAVLLLTMFASTAGRCASVPGARTSASTRSTPTTRRWWPNWSACSTGAWCTRRSTRSTSSTTT